jgi:Domain of unknown function (DUF4345)
MTKADVKSSQTILIAEAVLAFVYGAMFLLVPHWLFAISQDPGVPDSAGWVRWSGGLLIGVGVAAWLATNKVQTQKPLVVGLIVATALVALSLLYSLFVGGFAGAPWFLWVPIVLNAALAVAFAWAASKMT